MPPSFVWNKGAQRFRYSSGDRAGQFVSKAAVRGLMEDFIRSEAVKSDRLTASLLNGKLSLKEWEAGMAKRIKAVHATSYLIGKGGSLRYDSQIDKGRLGSIVRREYKYLRNFSEAIRDGKLSKPQIRARARSYMVSAYKTEQRAEQYSHADNGYKYEKNVLGDAEHCPDCVYFSGLGIVPIGSTPPIGEGRQCQGSCRCHKDYFQEMPEEAMATSLQSRWGWCA